MRIKSLVFVSGFLALGSVYASEEVNIPVVPASIMTQGVPPPMGGKPQKQNNPYQGLAKVNEESVLVMEQGVNQIVPIAITHPNRIVTPFNRPEIQSVIDGNITKIETKGNAAYVSTKSEKPVTLFITEYGDQSRALSLTLVPQSIPARELILRLPEGVGLLSAAANERAEKWEESQPYIQTIRDLFRHIALGEVPQGYSMHRMPTTMTRPSCSAIGLTFDFANGQVLMGHNFSVLVGVARNVSEQPIEFRESVCGGWDVAAVAAWPLNVLEPGQRTEVYVARKVGHARQGSISKRPSLVGAY